MLYLISPPIRNRMSVPPPKLRLPSCGLLGPELDEVYWALSPPRPENPCFSAPPSLHEACAPEAAQNALRFSFLNGNFSSLASAWSAGHLP